MSRPEPKGMAGGAMDASDRNQTQTSLRITVVQCLGPRQVQQWSLVLPAGATAQQALAACDLVPATSSPGAWLLGIWGRRCTLQTVLRTDDRLEIYRPLKVDPKVARRERFKGQGARTAGLFARRRPGAKPGY